jgi:hypothetical protein
MKIKRPHKITRELTLVSISFALMFSGCKKLVEIDQPTNTISTVTAFTSDAQAASTLAGMYSYMIQGGENFSNGATTIYMGLAADELNSYAGLSNKSDYNFETNKLQFDDSSVPNLFYNPTYKTVYNANNIIDGVAASTSAGLSDSSRVELTAEAKFTRAFAFFYLTNIFGDIPMPLTYDFTKTALLPQTTQANVYIQIIKDLQYAQSALPSGYPFSGNQRTRPNKWAATAMLARTYLYEKDWKDAEAQASAVIGNNQFSLLPDLTQVFLKNSGETIWQLEVNSAQNGHLLEASFAGFLPGFPIDWGSLDPASEAYLLDPSTFAGYASNFLPAYYCSNSLSSAFEPNDLRKTTWTQYSLTAKIAPWNGNTVWYPYKYDVPIVAGVAATQYYMVLRLAEQYLIRAEARAEQNNLGGAAADLNVIRMRAGLPPTTASNQADLLNAVAQERRVELFAEWGHRWFDLKRTGKATTVLGNLGYKKPFSASQLLFPIPQSELIADPNLKQNPGY